nr:MAG TPA: hypothetical protein [Microviridae sp.]
MPLGICTPLVTAPFGLDAVCRHLAPSLLIYRGQVTVGNLHAIGNCSFRIRCSLPSPGPVSLDI